MSTVCGRQGLPNQSSSTPIPPGLVAAASGSGRGISPENRPASCARRRVPWWTGECRSPRCRSWSSRRASRPRSGPHWHKARSPRPRSAGPPPCREGLSRQRSAVDPAGLRERRRGLAHASLDDFLTLLDLLRRLRSSRSCLESHRAKRLRFGLVLAVRVGDRRIVARIGGHGHAVGQLDAEQVVGQWLVDRDLGHRLLAVTSEKRLGASTL